MSMLDWAKKEIELAKKRENPNLKDGEFDYGCACYDSALKAFESLSEDGHSGMSMSITMNILNRLINGDVLTPIENNDEDWYISYEDDEYVSYRHSRSSKLFKNVYTDGTIKYTDINRVICKDIKEDIPFHNGFLRDLVEKIYPIEFPYLPETKPYVVIVEQFSSTVTIGYWDYMHVIEIITPNGERDAIHKYFKEENNELVEIDYSEFLLAYDSYQKLIIDKLKTANVKDGD